jgi:hypothetical protein
MPNRKCKICGKEFYTKPFYAKKGWGKYCSIKCRSQSQFNGKWVECVCCGKKIYRTPVTIESQKAKDSSAQLVAIVLGKIRMCVVALMHQIG